MKVRVHTVAGSAVLLILSYVPARADVFAFNFTLSPNYSGLDPLNFTLDSSQPPTSSGPVFDGSTFYHANVPVFSNGTLYTREVGFGRFLGDFTGYNTYEYEFGVGQSVTLGPGEIITTGRPAAATFSYTPLFTGSSSTPVFVPGVYTVPNAVTLTITDLTTAVTPEPSGLVLLGTGLVGVMGLVRRRGLRS